MARALELAWRGWGRVQPNPLVGAVVLADGEIVGEGWHAEFGAAPRRARRARRGRARGPAEPRSSARSSRAPTRASSRRAPRRILAAGVRRVVAAVADPEPGGGRRRGRGSARAGVEVELGLLRRRGGGPERRASSIRCGDASRPFVALKLATTIDGRIADANGHSRWLSGAARARLRAVAPRGLRRGRGRRRDGPGGRSVAHRPRPAAAARAADAGSCSPPMATCRRRSRWSARRGEIADVVVVASARRRERLAPLEAAGVSVVRAARLRRGAPRSCASGASARCWSKAGDGWPARCSRRTWWTATTGCRRRSGSASARCPRSPASRPTPLEDAAPLARHRAARAGRRHAAGAGPALMFTGIVTAVGQVSAARATRRRARAHHRRSVSRARAGREHRGGRRLPHGPAAGARTSSQPTSYERR